MLKKVNKVFKDKKEVKESLNNLKFKLFEDNGIIDKFIGKGIEDDDGKTE